MSEERDQEVRQYFEEKYAILVGATITSLELKKDGEYSWWPIVHAKTVDGTELVLEISQDDEGNGPGAIFMNTLEDYMQGQEDQDDDGW